MLRRLIPFFLMISPAFAGIWPEAYLGLNRTTVKRPPTVEAALAEEYGVEEAEQAAYSKGGASFTATAFRLKDSTGATALYQLLRPAGAVAAKPETVGEGKTGIERLAAETGSSVIMVLGNYVL